MPKNLSTKGVRWAASLAGALLLLLAVGAAAARQPDTSSQAPTSPNSRVPLVRQAAHSDVSRPLRDIPSRITHLPDNQNEANENAFRALKPGATGPDMALQKAYGPNVMPGTIQNFEGMYNQNGPIPPDTNGDVGRNHYVQIVNSMFQVFSKTGTSLYGPTNINTLWTGFGGVCETYNDGDPIALYDAIADRWLISQFNFVSQATPTHQCFAISTSPDPTGSYYRYDFQSSPAAGFFEDYPHISVWPDAYYMTTNEFGPSFAGGNFAYDRSKMLRGDPTAAQIYFPTPNEGGMLSSHLSGGALPPAGSPNFFMDPFDPTAGIVNEYKFHVDFTNPALSTFTGPIPISVTPWDDVVCGANRERCVPQPGVTSQLETLAGRFMYRLSYRNNGGVESLVVNHTVNAGAPSPNGRAGIRWYEFRNPNTVPTVFQQGTYAPTDTTHRWMGSIVMDRMGDIAMGFSASSSTLFPSILYAGRLVSDPPGMLSQGEATLLAGTGSEDFPAAPRWGDYSAIGIDPADDCTFWYTQEYFSVTGLRDWRTRIGSFKFPSCAVSGTPTPAPSATGAVPTMTRTPGATPTLCAGGISVTGSITNTTSPTQTGRLGLGSPVSSCTVPKPVSGLSDSFTRHYQSYTYTNSSGSAQCVTVSITQACGNNAIQSVTYLGSFNPASIQTNYLADGGAAGASFSYSFTLPAAQTAVVVVVEVSPNLGCATYSLTINPCAAGAVTPSPTTVAGTATATPVTTPSVTPTVVCTGTTYQTFPSSGATLIPATNDIGNHCDDCNTNVTLPFPVTVYGQVYTNTNAGSNGILDFGSNQANIFTPNCLPVRTNPPPFTATLFPYYDDLRTDVMTATHGIYSATIGTAPNRQFILEWNATYFISDTLSTNFEVVMSENSPVLSVIYGQTGTEAQGANPGSGIQLNLGQYTAYSCHTDLPLGLRVDYVPIGCGVTPSPTPAPPTSTRTATAIVTVSPGTSPTATVPPGSTATASATACSINFSDVATTDYFYVPVQYLYCHGVVSGYSDGTFRPYNFTTRSQMIKIVVLGFNKAITTPAGGAYTFTDVLPSNSFFNVIETAAADHIVSGYNCGSPPAGPCDAQNRPYFLPYNFVTRGELAKIDIIGAGFTLYNPVQATFTDVPRESTFYTVIETAVCHGVISGYSDGTFHPYNNATRGQIAKIVYLSIVNPPGNCQTLKPPIK